MEDLGEGRAVLKFDLSAVPQGAKVYRAGLRCERRPIQPADPQALADIEIYPLAALDWYTGVWRGMSLRRDTPILAFSNCTTDGDSEASGRAGGGYSWKDLKDEADAFSVTVLGATKSSFDLTPRRLAKFKIRPNEKLRYEVVTLPGQRGETAPDQTGQVAADAQGVVTLKGLEYAERIGGLVVKITRPK